MLWSSIKHLQWFSIDICTLSKHYIFIAYIMLITRVQEVQIILFWEKEVQINIPTFSWNIDMEELVNISIFNIKHNMVVNNHWWYLFLTSMTVPLFFLSFPIKSLEFQQHHIFPYIILSSNIVIWIDIRKIFVLKKESLGP